MPAGSPGVGYAFAFGKEEATALAAMVRLLAPRLVGSDALAIEAAWAGLWRSLALLGQAGAGVSALAALDIALWDLKGKALNLPLHRLLGGARTRIPTYGSGGSLDNDARALAAEMAGYAAAGHPAVKLKLGHGLAGDRARLAEVRRAVGDAVQVIVDGNQQWTAKQAIAHARGLGGVRSVVAGRAGPRRADRRMRRGARGRADGGRDRGDQLHGRARRVR